MKLKIKTVISCVVVLTMVFSLGGCTFPWFSSSSSLMHPPNATGDKAEIQKAIEKRSGGDYVLNYPRNGENRSSITMFDLNNDEVEEAIALLTLHNNTDQAETHIYIIEKNNSGWTVKGDFKNHNNYIDNVDFGDMNGDGFVDLLVGWSTYSASQNDLYCYVYGDKIREINTKHTYTNMCVGNFIEEGKSSVMTFSLNTAEDSPFAELLSMTVDGAVVSYKTETDADVTKYLPIKTGSTEGGLLAAYVDGLTSSNSYNTQLLYFNKQKKKLENPIYKLSDKGQMLTSRAVGTECKDIDNDGVIEIPITEQLPYPANDNKKNYAFQTSWSSFDVLKNSFMVKSNVIINSNYGYFVSVPDKWLDKYTASYNADGSVMSISMVTRNEKSQNCTLKENVVTYLAVLKDNWTELGIKQGFTKMLDMGIYSYGYKIGRKPPKGFTEKDAVEYFVAKDEEVGMAVAPTEASGNNS